MKLASDDMTMKRLSAENIAKFRLSWGRRRQTMVSIQHNYRPEIQLAALNALHISMYASLYVWS
jgi:hypothetical protein